MTEKRILALLSLLLVIVSFILCLYWFNWKLFLIIYLCLYANNISNKIIDKEK